MEVRAKFKVLSVLRTEGGSTAELQPVTGGSAENEKYFKYTPFGEIKMGTINDEAAAQFVPGEEMYVTFSRV